MPAAIIPAIGSIAGGVGSAVGSGKSAKGGNAIADKQLALQQGQLNFGKGLAQAGMGAWQPAANYWSTLLGGDKTAIQGAVGPSADLLRGSTNAAQRTIGNILPAGGERNLALAQNAQQGYSQIGRLYAGVQPAAAAQLGQLSQIPLGAGVGTMGQGAPQVAAGLQAQQGAKGQAMQGAQGAGGLLYQGINKLGNRNQGGNGSAKGSTGTPPFVGDGAWTAGA
jgi:hypothetical protein